MASAKPKSEVTYIEARAEFDDVETCLGELAAYISELADGLSQDPEILSHALRDEWPDMQALSELRARWIANRHTLIGAWREQ